MKNKELMEKLSNENIQKGIEVMDRINDFIFSHNIICEEAIGEDRVIEDLPYLLQELCNIVGYLEDEGEEY